MDDSSKQAIVTLMLIGIFYGIGGYAIYMFVNEWQAQYAPYVGAVGIIVYWVIVTLALAYLSILQARLAVMLAGGK